MKVTKKTDNDTEIINGLNSVDIANLYQYVCEYDSSIKGAPGSYDIKDKAIINLLDANDIYFDTCAIKNQAKAYKHKYYILFEQTKKQQGIER